MKADFALSRHNFHSFFPHCERGSRPNSTQSARLGFSGVILCEPRRSQPPPRFHKSMKIVAGEEKKRNFGRSGGGEGIIFITMIVIINYYYDYNYISIKLLYLQM